jgi:hypothetical protein
MNRTLAYASLHANDALRSKTGIYNCWSCTVTRSHSQWSQSLILRPAPPLRSRPNSPPVRLLSKQRARKQMILGYRNNYPLLKGESPRSLPLPAEGVRAEERYQRHIKQISTDEARLNARKSKSLKDDKEKAENPHKISIVFKNVA